MRCQLLGLRRQICQTAQKIVRALTQQGYLHWRNMPRKRHAQPVTGTGKAAPAKRAKRPLPQASPLPKPARGYMGWLHAKAKARRFEHCLLDGPAAQAVTLIAHYNEVWRTLTVPGNPLQVKSTETILNGWSAN